MSGLWEITNIGCPFYWILRGGEFMGNRKSNLIDRQSKFCLFEVEKRIAVVEDIDIVCQALGEQITVYRTGIQVLDGLQYVW